MSTFNYKLTTYKSFLEQAAAFLGTNLEGDLLRIPEDKGSGYFRRLQFGEDVEALIFDFKLHSNILLKREKDEREFYTFNFEETNFSDVEIRIGNDTLEENPQRSFAMYLSSYLHDQELLISKNTPARGFRVLLTPEWMKLYLKLERAEDTLEKYISMKATGIWSKPIGNESRSVFNEIFSTEDGSLLFYQNRILRTVEIFFEWLYNQSQYMTANVRIARDDIKAAQKIEATLTNDVTVLPPTIKELAKSVAMSESKLKKIFKGVYGLPPYEYYQKQRMLKAKEMLLSGNYSIKDVGYTLGYSNLSNFTLAFKKEFDQLPSEVLKEAITR